MKAIVSMTVTRIVDLGEPQNDQTDEDFIQVTKEDYQSYPLPFVEDAQPDNVFVLIQKIPT